MKVKNAKKRVSLSETFTPLYLDYNTDFIISKDIYIEFSKLSIKSKKLLVGFGIMEKKGM